MYIKSLWLHEYCDSIRQSTCLRLIDWGKSLWAQPNGTINEYIIKLAQGGEPSQVKTHLLLIMSKH